MEKEKWNDVNVNVNCVWVLSGDEDGMENEGGVFEGRKWKRKMERKNWIENEMKINGDGDGKNKLVE